MQSSGSQVKDASHSRGLKHEVGTPQTSAQRPAHPSNTHQDVSSARGITQDPHSFPEPAGGLKASKEHHARVRDQRKHSGQDIPRR